VCRPTMFDDLAPLRRVKLVLPHRENSATVSEGAADARTYVESAPPAQLRLRHTVSGAAGAIVLVLRGARSTALS
jgi:hypothetical protein